MNKNIICMFSCLLISFISHASRPAPKDQTDCIKTKAIKSLGYGASDASVHQEGWEQIQEEIQKKLQPVANAVLYKSIIEERIYKQFPAFKKHATPAELLVIKKNSIKAVAKKMIKDRDWQHTHASHSSSDECARELQEDAIAKSSKLSWLARIPSSTKQELDEVSMDNYATMLPELYNDLESNWNCMTPENHKAQSLMKMKELHKKYSPTEALSDKELQDMFEKHYAQFKKKVGKK